MKTLYFNGTRVVQSLEHGDHWHIPYGVFVPYIIGVPSVRAEVLGLVGDCYVLRQEYDVINEEGKLEHVKKDYYRDKKFIEGYWLDTVRLASHCLHT